MKFTGPQSSGSVGSLVYSRNRGGQYTRNRVHPAQPVGTGRRALVRSYMQNASASWQFQTDDQRAQWDAAALNHPRTNAIGQRFTLTGQQLFIALGCQLQNVGAGFGGSPPTDFSVWQEPPFGWATTGIGDLILNLPGAGSSADFVLVSVSPQVSPGRKTWFTWWQIQTGTGDFSGPEDLAPLYTPQFGSLVSGKRIFCKVTPVSQFGVTGVPLVQFLDLP